jgi:hypothetical protein
MILYLMYLHNRNIDSSFELSYQLTLCVRLCKSKALADSFSGAGLSVEVVRSLKCQAQAVPQLI